MSRRIEDALAESLERLDAGAGIEEVLRGQEDLAAHLRPLLEAAMSARVGGARIPTHSESAFQRGRLRMHAARVEEAGRRSRAGIGFFGWRTLALAGAAAAVGLLVVGTATDVFRFGAQPTLALDGFVSRVDPNAIHVTTDDGERIVIIDEATDIYDETGAVILGQQIAPGKRVKIEVEKKDGEYEGRQVNVEGDGEHGQNEEVEFSGVVATVSGSLVEIDAPFGTATVHLDANTEIKGAISPGRTVKVHAMRQNDGSYLATEIEVADAGDGGDNSGPGGTEDGNPEGGDNSGSGSSDDGTAEGENPGDDHGGGED